LEIGLLMRDLWGMKEDAVLNDSAHLVARVGSTRVRQIKEVTVDSRHAASRGLAHRARGLLTPVDGVFGEVNIDRVLSSAEGEDVDRCEHAVMATVD
jgi:hypothetical protein